MSGNKDGAASGGTPPIAIVGMSALFPGALTTAAFWRDILEGRDRLGDVPRTHWLAQDYFDPRAGTPDKVPTTRGGFLPEVDFSPLEFGLPPNIAKATDTAQLLALVVAKRALLEATRGRLAEIDRSRISVILGVASATELVAHMSGRLQIPVVERAMRAAGLDEGDVGRVRGVLESCYVPWQESTFPGLLGNVVAGRIANRLDLGGTNAVVDAACASSLAAVDMAINELALGRSDLVLTGGIDTLNDILMFMCFAQTGALSPSGDCRPFSSDADGTMLGEGLGVLALRRLADAERDGDPIYAVIRGIGTSSDGRAKSIYAPAAAGQALALRRAYERAGYGPETVGLVEAHGTGTKAGDAAEVEALQQVFGEAGARPGSTALGSIKAQIGHTKAAAGSAGVIKAVLALHHKVLPGTSKVTKPNEGLGLEASAFFLGREARPWIHAAAHPRRASVSALGFGGTNFHVALEEYRGPAPRPARLRAMPSELVLFSANDAHAIAALCRQAAKESLVHLARRSQLAFDPGAPARLAIVASDAVDLSAKLASAAATLERSDAAFRTPTGIHFTTGPAAGPVAFLFPGQGSQYVGMGGDVAIHFAAARETWDRTSQRAFGGERLDRVVFPPSAWSEDEAKRHEARLTATEWAQPAIAATSLALAAILERVGLVPVAAGGHSLGEVTARGVFGAIDRDHLVDVARRRGELMAAASSQTGAMTAVAADLPTVRGVLGSSKDVVVANHNAPAQVVLSGALAAIEDVERRLAAKGLEARRLPVSTAFHSPLVATASAPFAEHLATVPSGTARVPLHGSRDLAAAIAEPVLFVDQIEAMYAGGARIFVEVGPGSVLTKLVGRCLEGRPHVAIELDTRGKNGVTALWEAFGRLAVAGVRLDFAALWQSDSLPDDPTQAAPAKLNLRLTGANYDKPSPPEAVAAPPRAAAPPPAAPPPAAAPALPPAIHESVIAAQMEYQRLMAESHAAFLQAIAASYGGAPVHAPAPVAMTPAPVLVPAPVAAALPAVATPVVMPPAPVAGPVALAAAPVAAERDLVTLMLDVVADKTGYPAEMIQLGMDLESDLGIDSIKRVEILSAVKARAPGLPQVDTARMARMRTLREIVDFFGGPSATPARIEVPAPAAATPPVPERDLVKLMLDVVADKTGYPAEMIQLGMDLESDLGIDSIKRVEILSAVKTRAPGLPQVDTARMARMRTLREIVDFFEAPRAGNGSAVAAAAPPPTAKANGVGPHRATASAPHPNAPSSVERIATRAVPAPPCGFALRGLAGAEVLVTPDGGAVARALVADLGRRGIRARAVETVPEGAQAVVFLGGLRPAGEALAASREAFAAARTLAPSARVFVTVQDTGGDFGLSGQAPERALFAGLAALAKTAAAEWPQAAVRAIDVERAGRDDDAIAAAIADELLEGGTEIEVGLRASGERVRIASVAGGPLASVSHGTARIPEGAVFVCSGGARGVTAECLIALARTARPKLLLLGRSALVDEPPAFRGIEGDAALKRAALEEANRAGASTRATPKDIARRVGEINAGREIRATLRRLEEAGATARYVAVDVRDRAALGALLDETRRSWGPIAGLVHAAGVLSDARLDQKTDAQFSHVYDTKVEGLRALLDATRTDGLRWLCFFSSVAARTGNPGQADYAMANAVLDKVAAAEALRRGSACRVISIGWGPWEGGMVTPDIRARFEARGVPLLGLEAGARAFVGELTGGAEPEIGIGGGHPDLRTRRRIEADILVRERSWPQLASHRIQGKVVLPVAVVLEWFSRLASSLGHEALLPAGDVRIDARAPLEIRDLRVVRGVPLEGYFDERGDRLQLAAELSPDEATASLELRDDRDQLRYTATVDLGTPRPAAPSATLASEASLAASPWKKADLYGPSTLFHGADFQVLESVDGISSTHARATLVGTRGRAWSGEWHSEPAALDGALQLAFLFGLHGGAGPSLPMRIARVIHRPSRSAGRIRCDLTERRRTDEGLLCDLSLTDEDGAPFLDLVGVEMFVVPSGTTAG